MKRFVGRILQFSPLPPSLLDVSDNIFAAANQCCSSLLFCELLANVVCVSPAFYGSATTAEVVRFNMQSAYFCRLVLLFFILLAVPSSARAPAHAFEVIG